MRQIQWLLESEDGSQVYAYPHPPVLWDEQITALRAGDVITLDGKEFRLIDDHCEVGED
jgi:hypothetical protein